MLRINVPSTECGRLLQAKQAQTEKRDRTIAELTSINMGQAHQIEQQSQEIGRLYHLVASLEREKEESVTRAIDRNGEVVKLLAAIADLQVERDNYREELKAFQVLPF